MQEALKKYPNETFDKPAQATNYDSLPPVLRGYWQGGRSFVVDTVSGKLATENTPKEDRKEYVITDVHDILHWVKQDDPTSSGNSQNASLYSNFETAVRNWWAVHSGEYPVVTDAQRPTGYDTVHTPENAPRISITSPASGTTIGEADTISVTISYTGTYPLQKTDVYLNNVFAGTTTGVNPRVTFTPSDISGVHPGENTLSVVATDMVYNSGTASIPITFSTEGVIP
jgi:hypothetical protein